MPVVAAVDRSERAASVLDHADRLARDAGTELHVAHVGAARVPTPKSGFDPDRDRAVTVQRSGGIARDIAETVGGLQEFEPVGLEGDPATALLEYSAERDAEYIVVSARKRSSLGKAVFGSVTQTLLLEADRPVVAVPHAAP